MRLYEPSLGARDEVVSAGTVVCARSAVRELLWVGCGVLPRPGYVPSKRRQFMPRGVCAPNFFQCAPSSTSVCPSGCEREIVSSVGRVAGGYSAFVVGPGLSQNWHQSLRDPWCRPRLALGDGDAWHVWRRRRLPAAARWSARPCVVLRTSAAFRPATTCVARARGDGVCSRDWRRGRWCTSLERQTSVPGGEGARRMSPGS